jgi:glycosyltransferase involved in cell wall biosynthesis
MGLPQKNSTKILFVDQTAQLGGAELCMEDILNARYGLDRVLLFQHGPLEARLRAAGISVVVDRLGRRNRSLRKESGPFKTALGIFDVLRLASRVAQEGRSADVLLANTPKALVVTSLAGVIARKPVVYHLHDILSREHFSRSNLWLLVGLTNRFVAQVIANSHATERSFIAAGGKTPVSVCYNGFRHQAFEPYIRRRSEIVQGLRDSLKLDRHCVLLGVFGRLAHWKGQHVAIQALKQIPGAHLVLVGDALFGEDSYKSMLQSLASKDGLEGRVHFLGFRQDVAALMQAMDVVVHCSVAPEPFGRVIVEAMLSKRPVVASRAGGAEEVLENDVSGLLAQPNDPVDLARCIQKLLCGNSGLEAMLETAHRTASERFKIETLADQVEHIAKRLAKIPDDRDAECAG